MAMYEKIKVRFYSLGLFLKNSQIKSVAETFFTGVSANRLIFSPPGHE
jgi:hypothetical protein